MMHDQMMLEALHAEAPNSELATKLDLYGRFVGSWLLDVRFHARDGSRQSAQGELHFFWVLEGRAVQDVWIYPSRSIRRSVPLEPWHAYGSTFRWYDQAIDAWRIAWFDPRRGVEHRQIGRAVGNDIVQVGEEPNGLWSRWRFVDIDGTAFTWLGERSWDKGATWTLVLDMRATRDI